MLLRLFGCSEVALKAPTERRAIMTLRSSSSQKKGDHDWAFGDYVCEYEEWKSAVREIVKADVSIVAFRDDLEGPFDPRDQGVKLWPKETGQIAGHRARI